MSCCSLEIVQMNPWLYECWDKALLLSLIQSSERPRIKKQAGLGNYETYEEEEETEMFKHFHSSMLAYF